MNSMTIDEFRFALMRACAPSRYTPQLKTTLTLKAKDNDSTTCPAEFLILLFLSMLSYLKITTHMRLLQLFMKQVMPLPICGKIPLEKDARYSFI